MVYLDITSEAERVCICVCARVCVCVLVIKKRSGRVMAYRHFEISFACKGQGVLQERSRTSQTFKCHGVLEEYSVTPQPR